MSGVELAACPFCGGEARLWMPEYPLNVDCGDATISCLNCDADGPSIGIDMDVHTLADWPDLEAEAIAAWNRRAIPMEAVAWRCRARDAGFGWVLVDHEGTAKAMADRPNLYEVQALALIPQGAEANQEDGG